MRFLSGNQAMEIMPFKNFSYKDVKRIEFPKDENKIEIAWNITFWCNYNCEYCFGKKEKSLPKLEAIIKNAIKLNKYIEEQDKKVHIRLIGGEVTYLPLIKILKNLSSKKIYKISLTTNLSREAEYFEELIKYYNDNKYDYSITASLHQTQIKDLNDWIEKAKKIATTIQCTVTNENCKESIAILNNIKKDYKGNIKVDVCRVKNSPINLTDENLNLIKPFFDTSKSYYNIFFNDGRVFNSVSKTELMTKIDQTNFNGKMCESNKFRMLEDGKVFYGSCHSFLKEGEIKSLKKKAVKCSNTHCPMCNVLQIF